MIERMERGPKRKVVSMRIRSDVLAALGRHAKKNGRTRARLTELVLQVYLEAQGEKFDAQAVSKS